MDHVVMEAPVNSIIHPAKSMVIYLICKCK